MVPMVGMHIVLEFFKYIPVPRDHSDCKVMAFSYVVVVVVDPCTYSGSTFRKDRHKPTNEEIDDIMVLPRIPVTSPHHKVLFSSFKGALIPSLPQKSVCYTMASILFLPLLLYICFLSFTTAQTKKHVSTDLFNSLEELSRLVDISYCVGTTGVQQPFQCLSHCIEFPDLELVTVSHLQALISTKTRHNPLTKPNPPRRPGTQASSSPTRAAI